MILDVNNQRIPLKLNRGQVDIDEEGNILEHVTVDTLISCNNTNIVTKIIDTATNHNIRNFINNEHFIVSPVVSDITVKTVSNDSDSNMDNIVDIIVTNTSCTDDQASLNRSNFIHTNSRTNLQLNHSDSFPDMHVHTRVNNSDHVTIPNNYANYYNCTNNCTFSCTDNSSNSRPVGNLMGIGLGYGLKALYEGADSTSDSHIRAGKGYFP
jgi:hypothetical protein